MGKFILKSAIGKQLVIRAHVLGISPAEMFQNLDDHLYFLINWWGAIRLNQELKEAEEKAEGLQGEIEAHRRGRGIPSNLVTRRGVKRKW